MALTLLTVVGARPQFIKAAMVSRMLLATDGVSERIVHTGQHFDANMSALFFDEMPIPDLAYQLDVPNGGDGRTTGKMLQGLEAVMQDERPGAVLVYGDTNSTLAGALAASKLRIPVVHVEAGLRSFNRSMPEEINRVVTDHVSSLLFCPTRQAMSNLAREGITAGVHNVGDVMYDAALFARDAACRSATILQRLSLEPGAYSLCTVHRAENTDARDRLAQVLQFLEDAAAARPLVFPVHPRTRQAMQRHGLEPNGLRLIEPVGYFDMHRLLSGAAQVLTDSGGLQKEAYFHRVPCITLRDETEWVETISAGWNRLWSCEDYRPRSEIADYGDGRAARSIVDILLRELS